MTMQSFLDLHALRNLNGGHIGTLDVACRHSRGVIGFNAMQSATARAGAVFRSIAGDGDRQ